MWLTVVCAAVLIVSGGLRLSAVVAASGRQATLQDYLALRCSGGAEAVLPLPGLSHPLFTALLHCWGCYAILAGLAMLAYAFTCARQRSRPSRPEPRSRGAAEPCFHWFQPCAGSPEKAVSTCCNGSASHECLTAGTQDAA